MADSKVWRQEGFDHFSKGTCGNAGHNLYVSKAGLIQRIHQFDVNGDGHIDLIFCNSHEDVECPPVYVYENPLTNTTRQELPSGGARSGVVADLNGDGFDDLVVGMWFDGATYEQNAIIYYGSPEGWSEKRVQFLPAPHCRSIALGDFNGDGKPDLAFLSKGAVRIFCQTQLGFEPQRFTEIKVGSNEPVEVMDFELWQIPKAPPDKADQIEAADLDGNGYADLIVRFRNGEVRVYWGSKKGINPDDFSIVPVALDKSNPIDTTPPKWAELFFTDPDMWSMFYEWGSYNEDGDQPHGQFATPQVRVFELNGRPHIFVARLEAAHLVPVVPDRSYGDPITLPCERPMAIAIGDVNGDAHKDIVIACQQETDSETEELSWVFWGSEEGFSPSRRSSFKTFRASDVSVGDLGHRGRDDIIISQGFCMTSWSNDCLIYRGLKEGISEEPVRLVGHNAMRALIARPTGNDQPVVALINRTEGNLVGRNLPAYLYYGGPDGFSADRMQEIPNWGSVDAICCDVNDDGKTDIVLANCWEGYWERSEIYTLLNGSAGIPNEPSHCVPYPATGICCADLNHDGYLDLVTCMRSEPEIRVFYGTPDGFDKNPVDTRVEYEGVPLSQPRWIFMADFNNDGWLDLFVSEIVGDRCFILWGGPDGFKSDRLQALSVLRAEGAQAADLTGNGYLDLIIAAAKPRKGVPHDCFLYIYWNGPEGLSESNRSILTANGACSISVADFNNDGMLDIFISNYWGASARDIPSYIYWNRKDRGFSELDRTELPTNSASGSIAADFNEDGYVDLAVAYHKVHGSHVGHSGVWWNGPDGFSEKNVTTLPTRGPHGMIWVDPGNVMDRGDEEYYTSCAHKLPEGAKVTSIEWEAELQVKTWVKAQLRSAKTEEALADAPWQGPDGEGSWFEGEQPIGNMKQNGPWVEYRLALGARNSGNTPRISSVSIHYN